MKRWLTAFAVLAIALCGVSLCGVSLCGVTLAEDGAPLLSEDGWSYIGYTYGGVTFAVPDDYVDFGVYDAQGVAGYVLIGGNRDFTLQMRAFPPEVMTYEAFKARMADEPSARMNTFMDGDSEVLVYFNTEPSSESELYGIGMTGLDGLFYKISIFTGEDGDCGPDALVWDIAETIGRSARHQDFSEWGVEDAPSFGDGEAAPQLVDWLEGLLKQLQ